MTGLEACRRTGTSKKLSSLKIRQPHMSVLRALIALHFTFFVNYIVDVPKFKIDALKSNFERKIL